VSTLFCEMGGRSPGIIGILLKVKGLENCPFKGEDTDSVYLSKWCALRNKHT
jgi:hypothetical protein